ncbi:hypothetical protein GEMRC1_002728 [Eukaryota sp. GEM-RC1]
MPHVAPSLQHELPQRSTCLSYSLMHTFSLSLELQPFKQNLVVISPQCHQLIKTFSQHSLELSPLLSSTTCQILLTFLSFATIRNIEFVCAAFDQGEICLIPLHHHSPLPILIQTSESAWGFAYTQSKPLVFSSNNSRSIQVTNLTSGHHSFLNNFHQHNIPCLDVFDDVYLASASIDGFVRVFDIDNEDLIFSAKPSNQWGWNVKFLKMSDFLGLTLSEHSFTPAPRPSDPHLIGQRQFLTGFLRQLSRTTSRPDLRHELRELLQYVGEEETEVDLDESLLTSFDYDSETPEAETEDPFQSNNFNFLIIFTTQTDVHLFNPSVSSSPVKTLVRVIPGESVIVEYQAMDRLSLVTVLPLLNTVLVASQASTVIAVIRFGMNQSNHFDMIFEGLIELSLGSFTDGNRFPLSGMSASLISNDYLPVYRVIALFLDSTVKIFDIGPSFPKEFFG